MPSSRQARMMRTAISPRFATRTRPKGGTRSVAVARSRRSASVRKDTGSERDVAMLLPRVRVALVREELQGADQPRTRLAREDDLVDVAARRGDVRIGERRLVFRYEPATLPGRIGGAGNRLPVDDVHGALRAHDGDLPGRPREVHVSPDVLATHDVVGTAVRLARDHRHL